MEADVIVEIPQGSRNKYEMDHAPCPAVDGPGKHAESILLFPEKYC